ncbi:TMEM175 family protein [Pseudonocardia sp. DLS-67]
MAEPYGAERLVFFTDAVVAIAITLLVLPLVDAVGEAVAARQSSVEVVTENLDQIFSFLLSFVVIARLWTAHHRLFAGVATASGRVVTVNMLWVLTIVALPFPTEMVGGYGEDRFAVGLYIGTILASSACLTALAVAVQNRLVGGAGTMTVMLAVAFLVAALVPGVGYSALLLLFLAPVLDRLWRRWRPGDWNGPRERSDPGYDPEG